MKSLKIAYFTHDSILEGVGQSQILTLCRGLVNAGVEVHLFSFEKKQPSEEFQRFVSDSGVVWVWKNFRIGGRLAALERILILKRIPGDYDLIHARSDLPTLAALLRRKEPVIWDIRSLWAEQRSVLDPKKFSRLTNFIMRLIRSHIARRISGYNTLTKAILPFLRDLYPYLPEHHSVVSTCVDAELFTLEKELPLQPNALLSGTYNSIYDTDLIRKFNIYMKSYFSHKVTWARGAERFGDCVDLAQDYSFTLTYADMPEIISKSSYGIAVCKNNLGISLKAAMPTKIGEFLSVGRPVVVNSNLGDVFSLLIENEVAVVLDNEEGIPTAASKLINLLNDPGIPERCRETALTYLSVNNATKDYIDLYGQVLGSSSVTDDAPKN